MAKSLKEYLLESKQTYDFKIKVVGDVSDKKYSESIKSALAKFNVENISGAKRTPIQEVQADFPNHSNTEVTVYDINLSYPATSDELRNLISNALSKPLDCVIVRNDKEMDEYNINNEYCQNNKSGQSLLNTDYEKSDYSSIVGDKHTMALLKELTKEKHQGEQYKGVNDKILAKKLPVNKDKIKTEKGSASKSVVGSSKIQFVDPKKGK